MDDLVGWFATIPPWVGLILAVAGSVGALVSVGLVSRARSREERARLEGEEARHIKNNFVAMVSHELRTPLTSIAGFAETLATSWKELDPAEVDEFLGYIRHQSHYLGDLVEDVLVIPRLEAGRLRFNPQIFDLGKLVHEVANMLFATEGREGAVSLPMGIRMNADPKRVQQVVRNLLENARKYGGDQVLVEGFAQGEQYVLVVSDNGPGVPEGSEKQIFEHFEQLSKGDSRSSSGIGLGLPIARRLARAMGGDVWYEPRFPTGSRFCFSMPAEAMVSAEEQLTVGSKQ